MARRVSGGGPRFAGIEQPDIGRDSYFAAYLTSPSRRKPVAAQAKTAMVKNLYAKLGSLARVMQTNPTRYAVLIGAVLNASGREIVISSSEGWAVVPEESDLRPPAAIQGGVPSCMQTRLAFAGLIPIASALGP